MCAAETQETANDYGNIFTIPTRPIGEISRILRPGGAVFIDVPNEDSLYFKVGNLYNRLRGRDWVVNADPTFSPYHVFGFSPRSLKALLSKHGLKPQLWRAYPGRAMGPVSFRTSGND
jgi:hypothetical protein